MYSKLENSAFPTFQNDITMSAGLSKRELLAGMAMQGFCVNMQPKDPVKASIIFADALLEELNK